MENTIHLLLLILGAATIRAQDLTSGGAQATTTSDIAVGEIRGTGEQMHIQVFSHLCYIEISFSGNDFSLEFWNGDPVSWRQWGQWGSCTGECGVGLQTRRRRCWVRETEVITTFNERYISSLVC